ncbi:hotdog fold thioesterase [Eggerthellaceae bacterium zg-887]|uniref:PaaI family thioesterase n=1 Tax=Xiamenia xianingshaonis TaxID=2682776 RepID=UPI00140D8550|nr:PaaI family thioesterase [Xiamenia xianingshaonis]NHM15073.1 hotdog fold thioesterase [Xiamenia xianingshaonis]
MSYLSPDRKLNPDHVRMFIDIVSKGEFYRMLGMRITDLRVGLCEAEVDVAPRLLNSFGGIHGGVYASILDTVTYLAMYGEVDEHEGYATLDLVVNDLKSVNSGTIVARAKPVRSGRHILLAEAEIRSEAGSLLATGTSKMFKAPNVQPLEQMLKYHQIDEPFPPKFVKKPAIVNPGRASTALGA